LTGLICETVADGNQGESRPCAGTTKEIWIMAKKTTLQKVLELVAAFVIEHKGQWCHEEWEGFLGKAAALGVELTDENKRNLGNLLEASKTFFCEGECACAAPAKKRASARSKTAAK